MRERLNRLIEEMLEKGVLYEDARSKGNLSRAAELLGLHRNTLGRKVAAYRIKRTPLKASEPRRQRIPKSVA